MAKDDKGRIRVFFAEFEGSSETLQDSVKALTAAVQRTFEAPRPQVKVITVAAGSDESDLESVIEAELEDSEDVLSDSSSGTKSRSSGSTKSRTKKAVSYKLIGDMDLRQDGVESLNDFCGKRHLADNQAKTAAFVYYMEKIVGVDKITPDHLYTCYKSISAKAPTNIGQIATNVQNRKGWIAASADSGYKMTVAGENFVEHDSFSKQGSESE